MYRVAHQVSISIISILQCGNVARGSDFIVILLSLINANKTVTCNVSEAEEEEEDAEWKKNESNEAKIQSRVHNLYLLHLI